jgi:hypothetical protein
MIHEFLRLLHRLARPPITGDAFTKYLIFLRFCIDVDSCLPIVSRAFSVSYRITVLDSSSCQSFLAHDFLSPALLYMKQCSGSPISSDQSDIDKLFKNICIFSSRLIVDEPDAIPHFPPDFVRTLSDIIQKITVSQARPFRAFVHGIVLNLALFPTLFEPEFVATLIGVSESREFTVGRVAVGILLAMLNWGPELLCDILIAHGTLDFLARFAETQVESLIGDILIGAAALACKCTAAPSLPALFAASPGVLELAERVAAGGDDCEFLVTADMEEAAEMLLQTVRTMHR